MYGCRGVFVKINKLARPFLKWAGGKRQLVPEIKKYVPKKYGTYHEPFVGAGALLFELQPPKAVINDSNSELINCYQVIKDSVDELIDNLREFKFKNEEEYYYQIRDWDRQFNEYKNIPTPRRAARILYLNKTCYNGLFRVNSHGQFNVPFGRYKNPNILDEAALKAINKYLNNNKIDIFNTDFEEALKDAKKGDFVYLDPPYDPISNTASFTGYDVNGFDKNEQKRLKKVFDDLTSRGCKVILSNASTDFIKNLYEDSGSLITVAATRNINSNAFKRGKVDEVLIFNYNPI